MYRTYEPTEEEIAQVCKEIQSAWTDKLQQSRAKYADRTHPVDFDRRRMHVSYKAYASTGWGRET